MSNGKAQKRVIRTTEALARHLGLSRWTVSRVLNGHRGVKPETARRVRQAMLDTGYLPNPIARGLRGARTGLVGVCFQEVETPILARKTVVLQGLLREEGYQAIIELTGHRRELEEKAVRSFEALKVDGVVLVGSTLKVEDRLVGELKAGGLPVVMVDPTVRLPFGSVALDREKAYPLILEHLHGLGHRRFAVIGVDADAPYTRERLAGLRRCARRLKLRWGRDFEFLNSRGDEASFYEEGYVLAGDLLTRRKRGEPCALICRNDEIALGAIRRCVEAGVKIPEEMSVTGFDNLEVAAYSLPSLTTIDQQVPELMRAAVDMLMRGMAGKRIHPRTHWVTPRLLVRESTGLAPLGRRAVK